MTVPVQLFFFLGGGLMALKGKFLRLEGNRLLSVEVVVVLASTIEGWNQYETGRGDGEKSTIMYEYPSKDKKKKGAPHAHIAGRSVDNLS